MNSNDEFESYKASNFKKDEFSKYHASNFKKKSKVDNIKKDEEEGFFSKLPKNLLIGTAELGRGLLNTPHNIANLFGLGEHVAPLAQQDFDYAKAIGMNNEATLSDKLIRGLAQYAPALALGEAELGIAGEALGGAGKAGQFAKSAIGQAVPQAAFGATQNENPLVGAAEGGIGSAAGTGLGAALEKGINAVRPSKLLRGNLTPKQLKENLNITKGTETGLGQVLQNPLLNRLQENVLPNILGSGAEKVAQRNAKLIQDKGTQLVNKMRGKIQPHEFSVKLQDSLKSAVKEARAAKNANFEKLNELADKHALKVGREHFQSMAAKTINDIEQSPELKHEFGKDLYSSLIRYANNKEGNNLKLTNIFRGKLGDKANELYREGKMHEYGIVNDLKDSLSKDIDASFEASGNPELKEAYQKAQKEYKEKYAPFEDKDIVKFSRQGGDPDLILSHFLKTGANDRATLLAKLDRAYKLNNKSQVTSKNLLPSAYLSKAFNEEGEINPVKFRTLYNKLGHKQREILFGKGKLHNEIKNYADLVGKNIEGFNLMFNPKTGQRLATLAQMVAAPAHIGTAAMAAGASKLATNVLTSPKFREKLINAMVKNKKVEIPKMKKGIEKSGAIIPQLEGNESYHRPMELELIGKKNK